MKNKSFKAKSKKEDKPKIDKIRMISSPSVEKGTGKDWDEWLEVLNTLGCQHLEHKEIVQVLKNKFKLGLWWQQNVATGYEVAIGRKIEGQNHKGEYSLTTTRTLQVNQKKAWQLLFSKEGLQAWLQPLSEVSFVPKNSFEVAGGIFGEVRTMKSPLRVRFTWEDSDWPKKTYVQIYLVSRPKNKCMLVFQHEGLKNSAIKEKMRTHWKKATDNFIKIVELAQDSSRN